MKCELVITGPDQFWFGPTENDKLWEERIVINLWEFENNMIKGSCADINLRKKYKKLAKRLKMRFE